MPDDPLEATREVQLNAAIVRDDAAILRDEAQLAREIADAHVEVMRLLREQLRANLRSARALRQDGDA